MLDIQFIRDNAELVAEKAKQKGYKVDIPKILELDKQRKSKLLEIEAQRSVSKAYAKQGKPDESHIAVARELRQKIKNLEVELGPIEEEFIGLLKAVPNMSLDDVPVGESEGDNQVAKKVGELPKFDFEPKTHWQIAEERGLIDKERAARVAGSRFAYIKGDLVKLQFAIIQFVLAELTNEETIKKIIQVNRIEGISSAPFIPVLPPYMIRTEVYDAMDRLEPRDERYRVGADKDDIWLQGGAEHTLGTLHMRERFSWTELPIRYLGYATSFRREAGTYGKDTEGIIRMHQFDKLEMESFTHPEFGLKEHLLFIAIQEYLMEQLGLPYQVIQKCTADIGKPNARGIDIEVWLPGQNKYVETHTADYMTDYQARRLGTKVGQKPQAFDSRSGAAEFNTNSPPGLEFVHTNDATAFALGRTMVAVIENYQQVDGKVQIPSALRPYMGGQANI